MSINNANDLLMDISEYQCAIEDDLLYLNLLHTTGDNLEELLDSSELRSDSEQQFDWIASLIEDLSPSTFKVVVDDRTFSEKLQILQQPYQSSKLRYRTDYNREPHRIGSLRHKIKCSKFKGPAILIPEGHLSSNEDFYIRVSLVTVPYGQKSIHFLHPYELEHARSATSNDRTSNSVWVRINPSESIKSFPFLRIVKKKLLDIQKLRSFRVFDCSQYCDGKSSDLTPSEHCFHTDSDILEEYSLARSQLAFTLAKRTTVNGEICTVLYRNTTVFSEEMCENEEKQSEDEQTPVQSQNYVAKYAPKYGLAGSNEEMLMLLRRKLDLKRHGKLTVTFKCRSSDQSWKQTIRDFHIEDRAVCFQIPNPRHQINREMKVDVILQQKNRTLDIVTYSYLPQSR